MQTHVSIVGRPKRPSVFWLSPTTLARKWKLFITWRWILVHDALSYVDSCGRTLICALARSLSCNSWSSLARHLSLARRKTANPAHYLNTKTVELLRRHRAQQAAIKLANGAVYQDYGLAFAKDWWGMKKHYETLGHPLQSNMLGQGEFKRLSAQAGVKPIKFHGLRHTCATLLLQAGVPMHVVQERLGHKRIEVTLGIYAHVLPSMQDDAATKLATLLQR